MLIVFQKGPEAIISYNSVGNTILEIICIQNLFYMNLSAIFLAKCSKGLNDFTIITWLKK